ncbi:MAG TPA: hypothetical protein VFV92_05440 [Candidatus Bathyarchaeia archaeon]|nr:hypothetical protein [Candidatus Bathyarchaeia archaeon]
MFTLEMYLTIDWDTKYWYECRGIALQRYGFDITGWDFGENNRCAKCSFQLPL